MAPVYLEYKARMKYNVGKHHSNPSGENNSNYKHGHVRREDGRRKVSPTYKTWSSMKGRCDYPDTHGYDRYGGRGISYDPEWAAFERFLADMGERPTGKTLDRTDENKNYCKENCQWLTPAEQQRKRPDRLGENRVAKIKALLKQGVLSQSDIAAMYEVNPATISNIKTGRYYQQIKVVTDPPPRDAS